mmetsp:Transcript_17035/g.17104  ORF Transcript_17035/g.17104 Transcript_17035/m.17104 type:complete len:302 (+) Transcript_17035:192-1097(+)
MINSGKRKELDVRKLIMKKFDVHFPDDTRMHELNVKFYGPADTPYHGGIWRVNIMLPSEYPYKSPSVGFMNRIFHPNVDEMSGSVCLDVINQTWSPMFDLVNIFESFLPQLLRYPNPADPLNGEAASLLLRQPEAFHSRARECVRRYASLEFSFDSDEEEEVVARVSEKSKESGKTSMEDNSNMGSMKCPPTPSTPGSSLSGSTDQDMSINSSDDMCDSPRANSFTLPPPSCSPSSTFKESFTLSYSGMKLFKDISSPGDKGLLSFQADGAVSSKKLEELVMEGMDVIDDGASDVSDMSEL